MADNSLTPKEEFLLNPVTEHNITDAAIASFETNLRHPVKVEVPLEPIQDLHGMDSPYPAGASVNLIPDTTDTENGYVVGYYLKDDGTTGASSDWYISEYIELDSAATYTWSNRTNIVVTASICFYDENKDYISGIAINKQYSLTFTPPEGAVYCRSSQTTYTYQNSNPTGTAFQLEVGSTATPYKRYSNICPIDYIDNVTINDGNKNFMILDRPYRIGGLAYSSDVGSYFAPEITSEGRYVFENDIAALSNKTGWRGVAIASQPLKKGIYHLHYTITSITHITSTKSDAQDIVLIDENYKILGKYDHASAITANTKNYNISVPEDGCRICINYGGRSSTYITIKLANVQLELGTAYTEYQRPKLTSIPITFTDPSTGDPLTVYGGTVTLNEDGSADVVSKWRFALLKNLPWTYYSASAYFRTEVLNDAAPGMNNTNNNVVKSSVYKTLASNRWDEHGSINVATNSRICVMDRKYTTVSDFISAMGETQIIYKLKTPQTYHFPNVGQLKAFLGTNNVWSDAGNVNVKYLTQNTETGMEYRGDRALELRRRAMIADAPTIHTTVGSTETNGLASFKSYVKAPVKSVTIPFTPKQDLHGYDHPWPAGGGKNLFNKTDTSKRIANSYLVAGEGVLCQNVSTINDTRIVWINCEANTTYTVSCDVTTTLRLASFESFPTVDRTAATVFNAPSTTTTAGTGLSLTTGSNDSYLFVQVFADGDMGTITFESATNKLMVEKGSTATAYAPYENLCPIEGWTGMNIYDLNSIMKYYGLTLYYNPYQDGSGDPSPDNRRNILPYTIRRDDGTLITTYGGRLDVNADGTSRLRNSWRLYTWTGNESFSVSGGGHYRVYTSRFRSTISSSQVVDSVVCNVLPSVLSSETYEGTVGISKDSYLDVQLCIKTKTVHTAKMVQDWIKETGNVQTVYHAASYNGDYNLSATETIRFLMILYGTTLPITWKHAEGTYAFKPVQEGTGDPSPENIRPVLPGLTITRDDDSTLEVYGGSITFNNDGTSSISSEYIRRNAQTSWVFGKQSTTGWYMTLSDMPSGYQNSKSYCNVLTKVDSQSSTEFGVVFGYSGANRLVITGSQPTYSTTADLAAYLTEIGACFVYPAATPTVYTLSVTETQRAIAALGDKAVTTIYGGTVTLNEDGSVDVISTHCIYDIPSTKWTYTSNANCWYITRASLTPLWDISGNNQDSVIRDIVCSAYKTETYNHTVYPSYAPCIAEKRYNGNWLAVQTGSANVRPVDCQVKMKLATPVTYHFSNLEQLKTFLGENNFWCDISDDITVKYWNRGFGN